MLGFKTTTPPRNAVYRPRNADSFATKINKAKGIVASNASEAAQLIPLVKNYMDQIAKFINNRSQTEVMARNLQINSQIRGVSPTPMATLEQNPMRESVPETASKPLNEPIPDDEDEYTEFDKEKRVKELKRAIKTAKLGKKDASKEEAELKELES